MNEEEIFKEIESAHLSVNDALKNRDFGKYMSCFTDNLTYKQLNGKRIGKAQLAKDTKSYFNRIISFANKYERKEIAYEDGKVVETLIQYSKVSLRIFLFFSKNWTVEREGVYQWINDNCSWKICKVEILNEEVY